MAGEIVKSDAVCLAIRAWSRTSHVTAWLTGLGRVTTVVKGATRPKSAFLGQYDLNYTCEILYYARAKGELHALRECTPLKTREPLRGDYRALVLAERFRALAADLAPSGPESAEWLELLERSLDRLTALAALAPLDAETAIQELLTYELAALRLAGLAPELNAGALELRGERSLVVEPATLECLKDPRREKNLKILLDAARVIGVYYTIHLDASAAERRMLLNLISKTRKKKENAE